MNARAARTHASWLVRDKGSFYLAMATGWLRLIGVDSGLLPTSDSGRSLPSWSRAVPARGTPSR
ncbi:hypothetical protein AB0C27_28020 [Nonomuraea sp. NPDC048882]|uniref:hypothetical protein n=1 Tax=unclassified Nonomuraea TaxID=2593643 RepID=UPI0033CB3AFC